MIRSIAIQAAVLVLLLGVAAPQASVAGHHEAVIQVYQIHVKPGKLDKYLGKVEELRSVMDGVESSSTVRVWRATAAGDNAGSLLVGVEYPNAAAWAAEQGRIEGDSDWQDIMSDLHKVRRLESYSLWRDISPNKSDGAAGPVLVVTGVQVKPGRLGEYKRRVASMQGISERLDLKGRVRMWQATLAGTDTGGIAVGVEYPSLEVYVAEQAKLDADSEWNRLIAGLGDIRTLGARSLYQEITP